MKHNLQEKAVLMRLSIGMPGETRQDPTLTSKVKESEHLGQASGKWVKNLYPKNALEKIKQLDNAARAFHNAITLPFDQGIGILPAELIMTHADRMRQFKGERDNLVENEFLADPRALIDWAIKEHNGTFDPDLYPGCKRLADGSIALNHDVFRDEMRKRFTFETCPLPVPNAEQFTKTVSSLLGVDAESVDIRVRDAAIEAQRVLLKRLLEPVQAMASKLAEQPKLKKDGTSRKDITFRDTLVGNLLEIADIAPKLNLGEDQQIDAFIAEVRGLANYSPEVLRDDKLTRSEAQKKADDLAKRMSAYKF